MYRRDYNRPESEGQTKDRELLLTIAQVAAGQRKGKEGLRKPAYLGGSVSVTRFAAYSLWQQVPELRHPSASCGLVGPQAGKHHAGLCMH